MVPRNLSRFNSPVSMNNRSFSSNRAIENGAVPPFCAFEEDDGVFEDEVGFAEDSEKSFERPKSVILMRASSFIESKRRFSGLMSRCKMSWQCSAYKPTSARFKRRVSHRSAVEFMVYTEAVLSTTRHIEFVPEMRSRVMKAASRSVKCPRRMMCS